jgi:hypothetical protein
MLRSIAAATRLHSAAAILALAFAVGTAARARPWSRV